GGEARRRQARRRETARREGVTTSVRVDLFHRALRSLVEHELSRGCLRFPGGDVPVGSLRPTELDAPVRTTIAGRHHDVPRRGSLAEARALRAACESEALLWEHRLIAARLRRRARLARAKGVVALTDSSADATDFAHPAWWRG